MKLEELKDKILTNDLTFNVLVFQYDDVKFNADEYINAIVKNYKSNKVIIDSLDDYPQKDCFTMDIEDNNVYVLYTDNLTNVFDINNYTNLIIVTKKVDKIVSDELKDIIIKFPKLQDWQIKDYIRVNLKGLTKDNIDYIYSICDGDIYRISNEIYKLKLFDANMQHILFEQLVNSNNYDDTNKKAIFNLISAISKKDYKTITYILNNRQSLDLDVFGLITLLKKNFKNVIDIQLNPKATADSLGMNYKQFLAIRYSCGKYSNNSLIEIYKFLNDFDYMVKSGQLDISSDYLMDYVINKVLTM